MKDEQIEAWFESIESHLKDIRKNMPTQNENVHDATKILFEDFIGKIRNLKFTVPTQDFSPLSKKIDLILEEAKRISKPMMTDIIRTEHYFFFFPDLKVWLFGLKRSWFIWALGILLASSLYYIWHLRKDYDQYKASDLKLRYMRYKGSVPFVTIVDRIDSTWNTDSKFRTAAIEYVRGYEELSLQEQQKQQRIHDLEKELDNLKANNK
jgi:hypothetical protein